MTDVVALTRELVAIDSVNPSLATGAAGETALAERVRRWCGERGLETHWLEPQRGRPSVVAIARGRGGGRSLMLNAHLDTVGVAGMSRPFEPVTIGNRMYGRGTMDMKSGLACCLAAVAAAGGLKLRGDVILTAVADEEHSSLGTVAALDWFSADAAVVTEPTDLDLHIAHRGFAVHEVTLHGRASHTSQPARGVNAVAQMGRVLAAIAELDCSLRGRAAHPLLGHGSAQPVLIAGGTELFTTPDLCQLSYERRTLPGESAADVRHELELLLERAHGGDTAFHAETRALVEREPFEVAADEPIVRLTEVAAERVRGSRPALLGAPYWMDAALIAAAGVPTVVFGPTGGGIHTAEEWVDVDSIPRCTEALIEVAAEFCA